MRPGKEGRAVDLARADARARRAAQQVFHRPLVLEAGAGTGKTTALVARVLAWSLGPGWERAEAAARRARSPAEQTEERVASRVLGRVVAITFTEAAAAEMDRRIGDALRAVESGATPQGLLEDCLPADGAERRRRARALGGALDHLVVQTIHAYCLRLLRGHPLEAGVNPRLEVDADGRALAELVRAAVEARCVAAYAEPGDPALRALAARGIGPAEIEAELLALLRGETPAAALAADPLAGDRIRALGQRLRAGLAALLDAGASLPASGTGGDLLGVLAHLRDALEGPPAPGSAAPASLKEWAALARARFEPRLRRRLLDWSAGRFGAKELASLDGREQTLREAAAALAPLLDHLVSMDVDLLACARPVLHALLADVERSMRAQGIASFPALLGWASELLAGRPAVAARVRSGIDQLLVDEFQDTDRRQCDLLRAIALSGPPQKRPGLLLVGDPKQSIYAWRSADLAAYDATVADALDAGGRLERLSVNYRSAPPVLDEVERAIAPIMRRREGVQPAFEPLVPEPRKTDSKGFARDRFAACEYWVSARWDADARAPQRATAARDAAALEAGALARELRVLHDEYGCAWRDFGVLFRSRTDWEIYLRALRAHGIPFAVEGDRSYYRRREIIDAAALVRCVLDPDDAPALLAWLRSAAVGVPDAALVPLWARQLPALLGSLYGASPEALAAVRAAADAVAAAPPSDVPGLERVAGWQHALVAAAEVLAELREVFDREPGDVFVERLRELTLLEAGEAARPLGAWRAANLDRFFRELADTLVGGAGAAELLRRLRAAVADEPESPEGRPAEILEDAVQVLTVHGAKGLDFEHVYLMQLQKGARPEAAQRAAGERRSNGSGACRGTESGFEYALFGAPTPGWDAALRARAEAAEAERVRTLYVAMTRARSRLVLAGLWPGLGARRGSGQTVELLAQRRPAAPELAACMKELAEEGSHFRDAAAARWVFPALDPQAGATPTRVPASGAPLPSVEEVTALSQRLAAQRESALARMALPFGARASDGSEPGPGPRAAPDPLAREVARAVGTAVHRVLEDLDLEGDLAAQLERAGAGAAERLGTALAGEALATAVRELRALLARVAGGRLLERLREIAPCVVARELPVLLDPEAAGAPAAGFVAGAIDLLYRDPRSGALVVADYKTDRAVRPADHADQGRVYQRAVREALGLAYTPRFELWYLAADRIEPLPEAARGR